MDYYSSGAESAAALGLGGLYSLCCCGIYIIPLVIGIASLVLWIYFLVILLQRDENTFKDKNGKLSGCSLS
jgi:hypothetical protein